ALFGLGGLLDFGKGLRGPLFLGLGLIPAADLPGFGGDLLLATLLFGLLGLVGLVFRQALRLGGGIGLTLSQPFGAGDGGFSAFQLGGQLFQSASGLLHLPPGFRRGWLGSGGLGSLAGGLGGLGLALRGLGGRQALRFLGDLLLPVAEVLLLLRRGP